MSTIEEYYIKIEWSKPALMRLIAGVAPENYCLAIVSPLIACGVIAGNDVMEYVMNEVCVEGVEYVGREEVEKVLGREVRVIGGYR